MADTLSIQEALSLVMGDVAAVGKDGRNESQNFNFRGIDAVVNAVGPALRDHGVIVTPKVLNRWVESYQTRNGAQMKNVTVEVEFTFTGPAGDTIVCSALGEASDAGDKATSKAHSVAFRTALLQALCIPTDEPDPDASSHERATPPPPEPVINSQDAARLAQMLNDADDAPAARAAWIKRFGVKPAQLPASRLAEAEDFVSDLTPEPVVAPPTEDGDPK